MKTIIIAGITRSGLTATMQMLHAGGYPCAGTYPAFEDNVNQIEIGKACKIVDTHHNFPPTGDYHVIRLKRDLDQQAKSIVKFLRVCGIPCTSSKVSAFRKSLAPDYLKIDAWAKRQSSNTIIHFEDIIHNTRETAEAIARYVDYPLDIDKMVKAIIIRSSNCTAEVFEERFL